MLLLLALAAGIVPLVLILSAVRGPRASRTARKGRPVPGDLQRPDLNFPEDDSREDLARYRGRR